MRERAELVSEIQRTEFLGNHLSSCLKLSFIMLLALVRKLSIFSFSQEDFSFCFFFFNCQIRRLLTESGTKKASTLGRACTVLVSPN